MYSSVIPEHPQMGPHVCPQTSLSVVVTSAHLPPPQPTPTQSLPEKPHSSIINEAFANGLYCESASPLGPRAGPAFSQRQGPQTISEPTVLRMYHRCKNLTVCNESSSILQHPGSCAIQGARQGTETTSPSSLLFSLPHHF